jgi:peptidoglycan/LPS O-acetylase OafA/YrhL
MRHILRGPVYRPPSNSAIMLINTKPASNGSAVQSNRNNVPPSVADGALERRIASLDGWRGISILMVVVAHLVDSRYASGSPTLFYYRFADALSTSGVCTFFSISGFIITKLALHERRTRGYFSAGRFYIRRVFRIVPPFYLYLAFVLLSATLGLIVQGHRETLIAAAFTCNLSWVDCGWFAGHSWSLAYEEQFYLLFPLLFLIPERYLKATVGCLFSVLVALPVLRYELQLGPRWFAVQHAAFNFSFICAGVLLALHENAVRNFCRSRHAVYVASCALLLLPGLIFLEAISRGPDAWWRLVQARMLFMPILAPASTAWLLGSSLYLSKWATRLLETRWLRFIGTISFSLYLWQQLFTARLTDYPVKSLLLLPPVMLGCAILSYYLVERPCVRLGKRLTFPLDPHRARDLSSLPSETPDCAFRRSVL